MTSRQIALVVACVVGIVLTVAWVVGSESRVRIPVEVQQRQSPAAVAPSQIWGN